MKILYTIPSSNRNIPKCYSSILLQHYQTTSQNSYAGKAESRAHKNRAEKPRKIDYFPLGGSASRACGKSAQRARKRERRGVCILPYNTQMKLIIILEDCLNGKHSNERQPQRRVTKVTKVTVTFSKMKLKTSEITFIFYIII